MAPADRLPLDSDRWVELRGGKGRYDAAPILEELREGYLPLERFWSIAWDELHHQGEVGNASYLAIPWIWQHYQDAGLEPDEELLWFAGMVERRRRSGDNEALLADFAAGYHRSLHEIAAVAAAGESGLRSFGATKACCHLLAVLGDQDPLAELLDLLEEDQLPRLLDALGEE